MTKENLKKAIDKECVLYFKFSIQSKENDLFVSKASFIDYKKTSKQELQEILKQLEKINNQ